MELELLVVALPIGIAGTDVLVGNDAGWALSFHKEAGTSVGDSVLLVGRDRYYAEIEATLPGASRLESGAFRFAIEGLSDSDHTKIAQTGSDAPTIVRLYLYWRDTNSSVAGYLASLAGVTDLFASFSESQLAGALVAELRVDRVSRRLGQRNYETVVTARERVVHLLSRRLTAALGPAGFGDVLSAVQRQSGATIQTYVDATHIGGAATALQQEQVSGRVGASYTSVLTDLAGRLGDAAGKDGRGLMLTRKDTLHFGVRPIPLEGDEKTLSLASGLIETEVVGSATTDPGGAVASPPPRRRQFRLTLKGRPDIFPGGVVSFALPSTEAGDSVSAALGAALLGASSLVASIAGDAANTRAYVESVTHRLGRTSGFSTVLTCVELLGSADDGWDTPTQLGSRRPHGAPSSRGTPADAGQRAAEGIHRVASRVADSLELLEVGEVRGMTSRASGTAPSQTLHIWEGLAPPDGLANQARRLAIQRSPRSELLDVSYASPFAWGLCGLVLPRYGGTRVVLGHRNGERSDPIDIGALFESGKGPDSQPGDWWLSLPAAVASTQRQSIPDSTDPPSDYTGAVTNDLIDADGNRVVEVASLQINLGTDTLTNAGMRPTKGAQNTLAIAHSDGVTSFVLKHGEIDIKVGSSQITVKDGEITISADKVTLKGSGVQAVLESDMNVS